MVTFHVYFKHPGGHELKLEIKTSGAETAIRQAKALVEAQEFEDFVFDGRVTRMFKSWEK